MSRCYICDKALSDKEVLFNKELNQQEPCTYCLDIAMDAAYGRGSGEEEEFSYIDTEFDGGGDGSDIIYSSSWSGYDE